MKSIQDHLDLNQKKILLRLDLNVPLENGKITDTTRIDKIIPELKGKLEGVAMRVPTPNVSLVELVFCTKKDISIEKINDAFTVAFKKQSKKILKITAEKLVSIDFNHNSASAIIDSSLTSVVGKNMGKISAWYDNEWGFSN